MNTDIMKFNDIRIKRISDILKEADLDGVDFLCHRNKPTFTKDGDRYEIQCISLQENDTVEITGIKVYPSYEFKLTYLTVDNTWRSTSINHIRDIVNHEISKLYE